MDRVLLKRLLGAGVMVALAVIVLPFFLQGEGYKAALRTDIPARPQPPQPLDSASREPPEDVAGLMEPPSPLPASRTEALQSTEASGVAKTQPPLSPKPPAPEAKGAARPAPQPPVTKPSVETIKPDVQTTTLTRPTAPAQPPAAKPVPEASKPEMAPGAAVKPAAPPAQPATKPQVGGVWMIQLGSFSAEANAQQLRAQVQRVGIPCQIEPLDIEGRKVWRVRAGPFATQAEADAALKRLQGGLKLGGMVMQVR